MRATALCSALCVALAGLAAESNSPSSTTGLARCTTPVPREGKAHQRFLELNERAKLAGEKAQIVFIGDSITQGWEGNGRQVWNKYYAPRQGLNLGIGSDHTQHVLWRLEHGNLDGLNPKLAVVLIGVNNAPEEGNSPADILAGVTAVAEKIREKLPQTKILLVGIFPFRESFNLQRGKALQVNQALHKLADDRWIYFLDIGHLFLQPDGTIPKEIMRDALHPSAEGYRIWAEAMEPTVAELLGEKPVEP